MSTPRGLSLRAYHRLASLAVVIATPFTSGQVGCSNAGGTSKGEDTGQGDDDPADGPLILSHAPGLFWDRFALSVDASVPGTIRYTLDGDPPDEESPKWSSPFEIDESTRLRLALFGSEFEDPPRLSAIYLRASSDLEFSSTLPVVVVKTHENEDIDDPERPRVHHPAYLVAFEPGDDKMADVRDKPAFAGRIGMHIRGNSTTEYPKKQYKIEIWDEADEDRDVPMLGMPSESDWLLHAPFSDKTLMRNHLVYKWSNRIGRYAARTRFVEVFIDWGETVRPDDYRGVYVWMEKIKVGPERIAISKLSPEDEDADVVSGGYLLQRNWVEDDIEEIGVETDLYEDMLLFESPKPEKIIDPQRDYIASFLDGFETALDGEDFEDPDLGYARYIDAVSFIDHHLMVELARNVDGFVLSTYMSKDRGGPLTMGPVWDYNGSLGNADYFEAWRTDGWHHQNPEFPADNPNGYRWYERLLEDPAFVQAYAERWKELRAGPFATDTLVDDIRETAERLGPPAERNFDRWEILGEYVWPNDEGAEERETYADEVEYLTDWLRGRLTWMDEELAR